MKGSKEEIGYVGGIDFLLVKKRVVEHICWQVWNLKMLLLLDIVAVTPILKCLLHMIVPLFTCEGIWKCQG